MEKSGNFFLSWLLGTLKYQHGCYYKDISFDAPLIVSVRVLDNGHHNSHGTLTVLGAGHLNSGCLANHIHSGGTFNGILGWSKAPHLRKYRRYFLWESSCWTPLSQSPTMYVVRIQPFFNVIILAATFKLSILTISILKLAL